MIQTEVSSLLNNGINFYWYQMATCTEFSYLVFCYLLSCLHKFMLFKLFLKCIFAECYVKTSNVSSIDHKLQMHSLPLQHTSTIFWFLFFSLNFHTAFYPLLHPGKTSCMRKVSYQWEKQVFYGNVWLGMGASENFTSTFLTRTWLKPTRPIAKAEWTSSATLYGGWAWVRSLTVIY